MHTSGGEDEEQTATIIAHEQTLIFMHTSFASLSDPLINAHPPTLSLSSMYTPWLLRRGPTVIPLPQWVMYCA